MLELSAHDHIVWTKSLATLGYLVLLELHDFLALAQLVLRVEILAGTLCPHRYFILLAA